MPVSPEACSWSIYYEGNSGIFLRSSCFSLQVAAENTAWTVIQNLPDKEKCVGKVTLICNETGGVVREWILPVLNTDEAHFRFPSSAAGDSARRIQEMCGRNGCTDIKRPGCKFCDACCFSILCGADGGETTGDIAREIVDFLPARC